MLRRWVTSQKGEIPNHTAAKAPKLASHSNGELHVFVLPVSPSLKLTVVTAFAIQFLTVIKHQLCAKLQNIV
jgi:hypothetical protein